MSSFLKAKNLLFIFSVFAFSNTDISAQILGSPQEEVWNFVGSFQQTGRANNTFIANYRCLDLKKPKTIQNFNNIAQERSGTLFLVGKLKKNSQSQPLLKLGGLLIKTDTVFCAGHPIESENLTDQPFILKVKYQASKKRLWDASDVYISPNIELAEIVYYKEQLTKDQSRVVESYLALKYSINITKNTEKVFRDYWMRDSSKVWTTSADGIYDNKVMALGRQDFIQWEQAQTYSSDAESIGIGLKNPVTLGKEPNVKISDGSMVVISNRLWRMKYIRCGSSIKVLPWQFRFFNWNTEAHNLYVKWDSVLGLQKAPRFTNGTKNIALTYVEQNGQTIVTIPLSHLDSVAHQTWYLVWDNSHLGCLPLANLTLNPCVGSPSGSNSIALRLAEDALPSTYTLTHIQTGEFVHGDIDQNNSMLYDIPKGQYHLQVGNLKGEWIDEIIQLETCLEAGDGSLDNARFDQYNTIGEAEMAAKSLTDKPIAWLAGQGGIQLFPNPIAKGSSFTVVFSKEHYDKKFTIQIVDAKGKLILREDFIPSSEHPFVKSLSSPGEYLIQFQGEFHTEVKQIIVK